MVNNQERVGIIQQLQEVCRTEEGVLMLINLDSFELFNDVYGYDMGDVMLERCAEIIAQTVEEDDIKARVGGDEFIVFCKGVDKGAFARIAAEINTQIAEASKILIGSDMKIPLGASIGGVFVPEQGKDYEGLFQKAAMALEYIKQQGNHGCAYYNKPDDEEGEDIDGLETITKGLDEGPVYKGALWLEYDYFSIIYKYLRRYIQTYKGVASKLLITVIPTVEMSIEEFNEIVKEFGKITNYTLRKSDVMMQSRNNQFFILLPEMTDRYIEKVRDRIMMKWEKTGYDEVTDIRFEAEMIVPQEENNNRG
jgi:diguanylate cyclase (GGDEF) domain